MQLLKVAHGVFNVIDTAFNDGKAEGLAEGKAEGLAEGEKRKALETARKLQEKGFSVEEICELTGLSLDDVRTIGFN